MADRSDSAILREATRLFITEQRRILAEHGTPPQGRLLVLLLRRGTLTQAEFGRVLGLEKSWVSRSVDKLVAQGWVERNVLPTDRRNVQLQLTDAGRVAARQVDTRMAAHAADVLERIPATRRQDVLSAMQALCEALQQPDT